MEAIELEYEGKLIPFWGEAYVNLTAMCAAFVRLPHEFLRLKSTESYIAALAAETGLPRDAVMCEDHTSLSEVMRGNPVSLLVSIKGNHADGRGQGTWAHPDLAIECARWCHPPFGIWCNRTIRRLLSGELIHPAIDKENLKGRESKIEGLKLRTDMERARYWKAQEIAGYISVRSYCLAMGLSPTGSDLGRIGAVISNLCRSLRLPCGKIRQRRMKGAGSGAKPVSSHPPERIHRVLMDMGYIPRGAAMPTPQQIAYEAAWVERPVLDEPPNAPQADQGMLALMDAPAAATSHQVY